ncbi:MAG: hypothetical protein GY730_11810 [bacterium]|nr:hypothetical protein [bacterium]
MNRISLYAVLLLMAVLLMSCGVSDNKKNAAGKEFLKLRLNAEPALLNPILSTDVYSSEVEGLIFNGLFRINSDLQIEPDLVKNYNISSDYLEYTFYLKENVRWHDGHKFTAHDVKFTFDKILDPSTNTVRRSGFIIDGKPVKFYVVDDYTLKAVLPEPFSPFLVRVSMQILPKHILMKEDINRAQFNRQPVGTGPFVFKGWKAGQFIKLERNEDYFGEKPRLKGVVFKIIPDTNTALIALEKGEIDYSLIPAKDFKRFQHKDDLNIFRYQQLQYSYIGFNMKNQFFSQLDIRKAVAMAVNKEAMVDSVLKGFGKPAYLPVSPVLWACPDDKHIEKYSYNYEKSRQLLNRSGFVMNKKTEVLEKNGIPFEFTVLVGKGSKTGEKCAQIIQRYLAKAGIKMNIRVMEWRSLLKIVQEPVKDKKFDAVMMGWSLSIDPDCYSIWHSTQYPQGFNYTGYINKEVDQLLQDGRREVNIEKRKEIYKKLYINIARDIPYLFLFYPDSILAVNKRVAGLSEPGPAGVLNKIEQVYLIEK